MDITLAVFNSCVAVATLAGYAVGYWAGRRSRIQAAVRRALRVMDEEGRREAGRGWTGRGGARPG